MTEPVVWEPHGYYRTSSNIIKFMKKYGYNKYEELSPGSLEESERIWDNMMEDIGIEWTEPYDQVLNVERRTEFPNWFVGGKLNPIHTLLDKWVEQQPDKAAYIWENESGDSLEVTYAELKDQVDRTANALRDYGVGPDDTVAIIFPLHPRAMVIALACLKIGAVQTHIFPGYGTKAIRERIEDCGARLVFLADGYGYKGKTVDLREKVTASLDGTSSVEQCIVYNNVDTPGEISEPGEQSWQRFVAGSPTGGEATVVDAEKPALILYTSGTTGKPKGTIHPHASFMAMGMKTCHYHFDLGNHDTMLYVTNFGWGIVPRLLLAGPLGFGATAILLGGSPMSPSGNRIWEAIENHEVTVLGMSPTSVRQLKQFEEMPRENHDLSTLRTLASTGEPFHENLWNWYFEAVGREHLPIINFAGGIELGGSVLSPTPLTPLKPGTLYGPEPGISTTIYDDTGRETDEGYLVVDLPSPGMSRSLVAGDERYLEEYWSDYDGVWNQNDWAVRDEDGFWFLQGRADNTMNISGRRVTAEEIEEVITGHVHVEESAAIGFDSGSEGTKMVAFVETDGQVHDDISREIKELITDELGAPFRPEEVYIVPSFPRTQSGKLPRTTIKSVYCGENPDNSDSLENAEVLGEYPTQ